MRNAVHLVPLVVAFLAAAPVASAQRKDKVKTDDVVGSYDVRYEEVSSNCTTTSIALARGALEITKKGRQLVVDVQRFPLMYGTPQKGGKVRATSKVARSSIEGVDTKVSVAGKVDEGLIQLVFIAEYFVKSKPLCSQTWNVSGQKSSAAKSGKAGAGARPRS